MIRRVKTGDCSTQYPLSVLVSLDGEEARFRYLSEERLVLRRPGGRPARTLTLRDGGWTTVAAVDASCRVSLAIVMNEDDVDVDPPVGEIDAGAEIDAEPDDDADASTPGGGRPRGSLIDMYQAWLARQSPIAPAD